MARSCHSPSTDSRPRSRSAAPTWRCCASLDAAQDGKWNVAATELASASNLFPNSPDVMRFRHDTERALQSMPLWRKHPVATVGAGGALVALVIGLAIPRVRRPRIPL